MKQTLGATSEDFKVLDQILNKTNNIQLAKICRMVGKRLDNRLGLGAKRK